MSSSLLEKAILNFRAEANKLNETARELGYTFLDRYGGKISSEWFFPKAWQILDEAPDVYEAADRLIEAADWVVWQLTGQEKRNSCAAHEKARFYKIAVPLAGGIAIRMILGFFFLDSVI